MVLHDLPQNESRVELDDKVKLTAKPTPVEASFSILGGEIVGIAGLMGSGRTALAKTIFGLRPIAAGEIRLKDKAVKITSPPEAMEAGSP
jgi:ribose transport system ATP-binding protein